MYINNSYTVDRSYLNSIIRPILAVLVGIFLYFPGKAQLKGALDYDGIDDYSLLPNGIVSSLSGDYTIEAWVYWRGGGDFQRVFDFGNGENQYMYISPDHEIYKTCFIINDGNGEQVITTGVNLGMNSWHHIAVVYTSVNTTGKLFIDGTMAAANTSIAMHPTTMGSSIHNYLGKSNWADPYFNGLIDEFRISNMARYAGDFVPLSFGFAPDMHTIALYHFDEGIGQVFADAGSFHFDGTRGPTNLPEASDPSWTNLTPLPVGLLNFSGQMENGGVRLNWQTVSEQNNKGFYIERASSDGGSSNGGGGGGGGFQEIGFVAGVGSSSSIVNYTFLDAAVSGGSGGAGVSGGAGFSGVSGFSAVTYRLRQTDLDGNVTYSPVVHLAFSSNEMKVYLSGPSLMVLSSKAIRGMTVYSYTGQALIRKLGDSKMVDVGMLPKGVYIVAVEFMNGTSINSRFVK